MVSKQLLMVVIFGAVLVGIVLGQACPANPQPAQHIYILVALEEPNVNATENWREWDKSEYTTSCWGICPEDVIRRNSGWLYNKVVGTYKLVNGRWERQVMPQ